MGEDLLEVVAVVANMVESVLAAGAGDDRRAAEDHELAASRRQLENRPGGSPLARGSRPLPGTGPRHDPATLQQRQPQPEPAPGTALSIVLDLSPRTLATSSDTTR